MSDHTEIAWTDATWNPWHGCHKVSEACKNCYMFRERETRYTQMGDPNIVRRSKTKFNDPLRWAKNADKFGHIKRVFTCSWSDFFIEEADAWRDEAWDIIRRTPQFVYQILTKRPERIHLPSDWSRLNIWLGITAENNHRLLERALSFYDNSSTEVAFVSVEPMLGPVNVLRMSHWIDWVICGCESGPGARETKIEWVRELRDQCVEAGIPFFLKQLMIDGKLVTTPELDGRRWTEFPR